MFYWVERLLHNEMKIEINLAHAHCITCTTTYTTLTNDIIIDFQSTSNLGHVLSTPRYESPMGVVTTSSTLRCHSHFHQLNFQTA